MDTLYIFWDNITHYKTKSVHFFGLMNSATKRRDLLWAGVGGELWARPLFSFSLSLSGAWGRLQRARGSRGRGGALKRESREVLGSRTTLTLKNLPFLGFLIMISL